MPELDTSWMDDEDFLWQAAGELLLALGVAEHDVAGLPELRRTLARLDSPLGGGRRLSDGTRAPLTDSELAEVKTCLEVAGRLGLPVADQALTRLKAEGISLETFGVDPLEAQLLVLNLRAAMEDPSWRTMDEEELEASVEEWTGNETANLLITPTEPAKGEVKRMVDVVRRMPKETVVRIAKVWNPLALRGVITVFLGMLRRSHPGSAPGSAGGPWATPSQAETAAIDSQHHDSDNLFLRTSAQMVGLGMDLPAEALPRVRRLIAERDAAGEALEPEVERTLRQFQPRLVSPEAVGYGDWSGTAAGQPGQAATGYGDWSGVDRG